jgi:hypothetical protein
MTLATQHWFCRTFQWGCDGGGSGYAGTAPEIGDTWALTLGLALVIGALCMWKGHRR